MNLFTAEYGLLIWTLFCLSSIVVSILALLHILKNKYIGQRQTLGWIIAVWFIPVLGSVLYFNAFKKQKHQNN